MALSHRSIAVPGTESSKCPLWLGALRTGNSALACRILYLRHEHVMLVLFEAVLGNNASH